MENVNAVSVPEIPENSTEALPPDAAAAKSLGKAWFVLKWISRRLAGFVLAVALVFAGAMKLDDPAIFGAMVAGFVSLYGIYCRVRMAEDVAKLKVKG